MAFEPLLYITNIAPLINSKNIVPTTKAILVEIYSSLGGLKEL